MHKNTLLRCCKAVTALTAVTTMLLGFVTIIGWNIHSNFLIQIRPNHIAMVYNTALCFVFIGIGLLSALKNYQKITLLMGLLIFAFPTLGILQHTIFPEINIDQLFMHAYNHTNNPFPGSMAPNTMICFLLSSFALLSLNLWKFYKTQLLILCVAGFTILSLAIISLLGYVVNVSSAYGWSTLTPMAMNTAFGFLVSSVGLIFLLYYRAIKFNFDLSKWSPAAVTACVALATLLLWQAMLVHTQANLEEKVQTEISHPQEENILEQYLLPNIMLAMGLSAAFLLGFALRQTQLAFQRAHKLEISQRILTKAQEVARLGNWVWNVPDHKIWCSKETLTILGLDTLQSYLTPEQYFQSIPPNEQPLLHSSIVSLLKEQKPLSDIHTILRPDKTTCRVHQEATITAIHNKRPIEITGIIQDITEQQRLQEQLLQSQKMEVLGQLTGGLAHDLNNLLMVIQGNLELLEIKLKEKNLEFSHLHTAEDAVEKGTALIKRLLTFSRRQPLQPKLINLKEIFNDLLKLLKTTLGESIEIITIIPEDIKFIFADPHQLENALLNLAVNSRDAMEGHGRLTYAISNAVLPEPGAIEKNDNISGHYIKIAVTDTGTGISSDLLERIFEPFFTTKGVGKGTGLGLSMVYGFIKQSKGQINIQSQLGKGTTINLFFPITEQELVTQKDAPLFIAPTKGGKETVLIVEDETELRELMASYLKTLGYHVITAENGDKALSILKQESKIDLLLTDIVMPGDLSGLELAKKAEAEYPHLKIILASGYPKNTLPDEIQRYTILSKPYKMSLLAEELRKMLDK